MTVEVTLNLSQGLVEEAQRLGSATSKDATTVLIYQHGQLRKSEAMAEAVKRGLPEPLAG